MSSAHLQVEQQITLHLPKGGADLCCVPNFSKPCHLVGSRSAIVALCLLSGSLFGQIGPYGDTTSTPILGVGHDYISDLNEIVDPQTGAVSVRIAAPMPHERGLNFPVYAYIYDSNGQYFPTPEWSYSSSLHADYVSAVSMNNSLFASYGGGPLFGSTIDGNPPPGINNLPGSVTWTSHTINTYVGNRFPVNCQYWDNLIYTDTAGGRHPFDGLRAVLDPGQFSCGALNITPSPAGQGTSDAVYRAVYTGSGTQVIVYDLHGDVVATTSGTGQQIEDTNGNYLNGTGRVYSTTPAAYASTGPPYVSRSSMSIPGLGGPYSFTSTVQARGATFPFPFHPTPRLSQDASCPTTFNADAGGYSGNADLTLPNQQHYSFTMDPVFGLLNHLVYPTGATVDYTWQANTQSESVNYSLPSNTPSLGCGYIYDWPAVKTRIVGLDGQL